MQRRNPGSTAALLQKANSQLKGEKIHKPEDELNEYISSLTHKTSQQKKSVNFEDLGESISISSDIEDVPPKPVAFPTSGAGSKFLKKKAPSIDDADASPGPAGTKFLKKPQVASSSPVQAQSVQARKYGAQPAQNSGSRPGSQASGRGQGQASSALDKVSALQGKIQQRAAQRRVFTLESDSDESFSAIKMPKTSGELVGFDPPSESLTTESVKVGRDGSKFMKKASPAPVVSSEPPLASVTQQAASPFNKGQKQAPATQNNKQTSPQKKASPFALKSSMRHSTDVVLTSEEESLAEFVGGLPSSSGDSFDRPKQQYGRAGRRHTPSPPPSRQAQRAPSPQQSRPERQAPRGQSHSPSPVKAQMRRSPSPRTSGQSPSPNLRRRSPSPKLMRSYSDDSNVAESLKSEVAEDYDIGMNIIMDLDDLGPAVEDEPVPEVFQPRSESPYRATVRKTEKEPKTKKSALKSNTDTSQRDKDRGSPFKSSAGREESPFKSGSKTKEKSPFAAASDSPFKSSSAKEKSPFRSKGSGSPFKADAKEKSSPFKAKVAEDSPFKAKGKESSPFKSSAGGSVFKAADKGSSPFKSKTSSKYDSDQDRSTSRTTPRRSKKKKDKKEKASKSKSKTKAKNASTDVFSSFGIQTVEDLLGSSIKVSEYESIADEDQEDRSDVSEDIRTEKPSAYSYSMRFDDSATEIVTEANGTKQSGPSYTDDFDSISERIGMPSDAGMSSASEVRTKYSGEETAADYTELSESDTETISETFSGSDKTYTDTRRDDDSYASYTETYTKSLVPTSRSDMTPILPRGMAHSGVQTTVDGLQYSWDAMGSGLSFAGVPHGLSFVDPTPIATHVVSADALETMTAYSPAMLALHDMLKSQLDLTRDFLQSQKRIYHEFSTNVEPTFHYTTLADTKKYIKKNKRKKLTFKEALKLVDQDMSR